MMISSKTFFVLKHSLSQTFWSLLDATRDLSTCRMRSSLLGSWSNPSIYVYRSSGHELLEAPRWRQVEPCKLFSRIARDADRPKKQRDKVWSHNRPNNDNGKPEENPTKISVVLLKYCCSVSYRKRKKSDVEQSEQFLDSNLKKWHLRADVLARFHPVNADYRRMKAGISSLKRVSKAG